MIILKYSIYIKKKNFFIFVKIIFYKSDKKRNKKCIVCLIHLFKINFYTATFIHYFFYFYIVFPYNSYWSIILQIHYF